MSRQAKIFESVYAQLEAGLSELYVYHNLEHTKFVMSKAAFLCEKEVLTTGESHLVAVAALYHDIGFLAGPEAHEERGCEIAKKQLADFEFKPDEIQAICGMIMATKVPQNPRTISEKIVADADLFYLGTERYTEIAERLYSELQATGKGLSRSAWRHLQVSFLLAHQYHTSYGMDVLEPVKQQNIALLLREEKA